MLVIMPVLVGRVTRDDLFMQCVCLLAFVAGAIYSDLEGLARQTKQNMVSPGAYASERSAGKVPVVNLCRRHHLCFWTLLLP